MTRILQNLVEGGKVVLALEGGYNLNSISASGAACVRALLGENYLHWRWKEQLIVHQFGSLMIAGIFMNIIY